MVDVLEAMSDDEVKKLIALLRTNRQPTKKKAEEAPKPNINTELGSETP